MTYKRIDTSEYPEQLAQKADKVREMFRPLNIKDLEVFESPVSNYRMRAEFRVWHEGDDLYYIMFNPESREKIRMDKFTPGSLLINQLMKELITRLKPNDILRRKLFQVDFLTTTTNEAIISLLYHRPLDDEWEQEAILLRDALHSIAKVEVIGRARKQKRVLYKESVTEKVQVGDKSYLSLQTENSFTQPNAIINQHMISWAKRQAGDNPDDLLELYCGNGNFTLPLAENFNRVLATEISKSSVAAARENTKLNDITNVTVVRMSAEEFSAALSGELQSKRAAEAEIHSFNCNTVLVDPPRAGLDKDTIKLVSHYQKIIYISCNPTTLMENISALAESHKVTAAAMFDQFPYTDHIETGVVLEKKS